MRKALFAIAGLLLALPGLAFAQFDGSALATKAEVASMAGTIPVPSSSVQPSVATIVDYICIEP